MKTCNKCGQEKALTEYKADPRNKSGLQGICRECNLKAGQALRAKRASGAIEPVLKTVKTCNKCGHAKASTEFFRDTGSADLLATICKACKQANTYAWRDKNKEKYNADHKAWAAKNYHRLRLIRYNLTPEQHAQMLLDQKGVCAICHELPKGKRPLVVDHDHKTKAVRGLLCYGCNRAIHILDNPELLESALVYLKMNE